MLSREQVGEKDFLVRASLPSTTAELYGGGRRFTNWRFFRTGELRCGVEPHCGVSSARRILYPIRQHVSRRARRSTGASFRVANHSPQHTKKYQITIFAGIPNSSSTERVVPG